MREVGMFEAKTHLSALVEEVARERQSSSPSAVTRWPGCHHRKHQTVEPLLPRSKPYATCASALGGRRPRKFSKCATKVGVEGLRPG